VDVGRGRDRHVGRGAPVRVLVTGAGGQLGCDLLDAFADDEVTGRTHAELDVADEAAVVDAVTGLAPDLVVNAAAWTDVDGCEGDPLRAHAVNALGPWWLARACRLVGATLVTVSTEHVFSGPPPHESDGTPRGWTEFDPVAPANVYGRTKAAGEELVRRTLPEHHIVRTSWVTGARGRNFVTAILGAARTRDHLEVVDDEVGAPTSTRDLSVAIRELAVSGRFGTWHRTGAGTVSRLEQARAIVALAGLDVEVRPISAADLTRPAARPSWSVLDATHATAAGLTPLPHWRDGLVRLLEELGELADPASSSAS
jgi:dTDP-4-dehydrorhamnose reductase